MVLSAASAKTCGVQIDSNLQRKFGDRVRGKRQALGLSQEAYALSCDLDRTYVSGIERGVRNPTLQVLQILARGLETTIADLVEGIDSPLPKAKPRRLG